MDAAAQRGSAAGDRRARLLAGLGLTLLLALILGGTMPYFEGLLDANERPRLLAGVALVEEGSVRVDGLWASGVEPGPDLARAADGSLVPNKPPGATLVAAGAYLLLRGIGGEAPTLRAYTILARILGGLLPTLILAALLWRHERAWARARAAASASVDEVAALARVDFALLAWLLATPAWANAKLLFGHSLAACLLGCGVLVLADRPGRELGWARAALGGLLASAAILVEYTAAFAGPVIGLWLIWRWRRRWPVVLAALGGALIPVLALAGYHARVFGSPWVTGYHRVVREDFSAIHGRGLLGLQLPSATSLYEHLISPWGGLLVWAPLCLLAVLAGLAVARKSGARGEGDRARLWLCSGVAASLLLVLLGLEQGGGWRVGPRYYVLAMPLCVPGLVALLAELGERAAGRRVELGTALVLGLFGAALVANFLAANWFPHLMPHGNPLGDLLWPLALSGRAPWGLSPWLVAALAVGLVAVVGRRLGERTPITAPTWLVAGLVAVALVAAQSLAPASDPLAELDLSAVERIWEPSSEPAPDSRRVGVGVGVVDDDG